MGETVRSYLILFLLLTVILLAGSSATVAETTVEERPIDVETDKMEIYLQSHQTSVDHDDSVIFTYSATNYITNNESMTVQLILQAPSGSEVFSLSGVESSSGSQFTTTTTVNPGEEENMRIHIDLDKPGEYEITGQAIYYFGENSNNGNGSEVKIPVEQRPEPDTNIEKAISIFSKTSNDISSFLTSLNYNSPLLVFGVSVGLFMITVLLTRLIPTDTRPVIINAVAAVLVISVIIAGIGTLGILSGSSNDTPESQALESDSIPENQEIQTPEKASGSRSDINNDSSFEENSATQISNEDSTEWVSNYDIDDFSEDLHQQSEYSVMVTEDYIGKAYSRSNGKINSTNVSDSGILELNGNEKMSAYLYGDSPGLGYTESFGEKIETLDEEGELTGLLKKYAEEILEVQVDADNTQNNKITTYLESWDSESQSRMERNLENLPCHPDKAYIEAGKIYFECDEKVDDGIERYPATISELDLNESEHQSMLLASEQNELLSFFHYK